MTPSISKREYIRWLPDKPSEPTSTIVVTSPENRFVDVRILKAVADVAPGVQTFDSLDWAFAGISSSTINPPNVDNEGPLMHSIWTHLVDSKYSNVKHVSDEGDMYPLSDNRTLEKGSMANPTTGKVTEYEELWSDEEIESQRDDGKIESVALTLESDRAQGMVIRVGQYCQGVLRVGEHHFVVERWAWEKRNGWRRDVRMGDLFVPCGVAIESRDLVIGGKVTFGDYEWAVVEYSSSTILY
ncbi:hypothetical protein DOTSEDRAFT_81620 [Dothistroma septosporum NZE10]|uniref:Protein HRI1 n=1 Tax=Dothistroma septosporum (strain NZE10 / CBS 128990) TaxID=675120 RepID=N1PI97_DOTSN|nr:hypothetical protein DOTSEDRAFT_81620 [Dothistroma septosporum NZE10]